MDSKSKLPLAVTLSAGIGGVSPPVSMLPEKFAGDQRVGEIDFGNRGEDPTGLLELYTTDANRSVQSASMAICEAFRTSFEQTVQFCDELMAAKGPADILRLQLGFLSAQIGYFADQAQGLQQEFAKLLRR